MLPTDFQVPSSRPAKESKPQTQVSSYKHQELYQYLMQRIRDGVYKPGMPIDSEQALCMRLKLSRNTVRQAMGKLENEGFIHRIQGKGTFLRDDAISLSRKIAMVVTDADHIGNPITLEIIRGLRNVFTPEGYTLELISGNLSLLEEDIHRFTHEYCGVLLGINKISNESLNLVSEMPLPFFFIENYPEDCADVAVRIDLTDAGYMAAEHLITTGRHNLAIIGADANNTPTGREFLNGVKDACLEYGACLKKKNIITCEYSDMARIRIAVEHLMMMPEKVDGIIASCDEIAICIIRELKHFQIRVPENIAVIGCNDIKIAALTVPSLSSIYLPMVELGEHSAEIMLHMLRGEHYSYPVFKPTLRIRESTGTK